MADGIGNSLLFIVIPIYVVSLPSRFVHLLQPLMVGILLSAYGLGNAILQPIFGVLIDRVAHHKLIIQAGLILIGLSTLAFAVAERYLDLLGLRFVQGVGLAMEIPPTMALITNRTRRQNRGGAMGF